MISWGISRMRKTVDTRPLFGGEWPGDEAMAVPDAHCGNSSIKFEVFVYYTIESADAAVSSSNNGVFITAYSFKAV